MTAVLDPRNSNGSRKFSGKIAVLFLIALSLDSIPAITLADDEREITYDTSSGEFDAFIKKQFDRNLAPVDLVAYRAKRGALFAAGVWEKRKPSDGRVEVKAGLTRAAMKQAVTDFGGKGFRLDHLSGSGAGGPETYTAIWIKSPGQQLVIRYGFPAKELLKQHTIQTEKMSVIHRVMAVEVGNVIRFTAVWDNDGLGERDLEIGLSSIRLKRDLRRRAKDGFRLRQLFAYVERRSVKYACIWEKTAGPKQYVELNMTDRTLKKTIAEMAAKKLRPAQLHAYSVNGRARFAGVWEAVPK